MEITAGLSHRASLTVKKENTAATAGSGSVEVFATPVMEALMEAAAAASIEELLEPGYTSVGTALDISHISATPVGMRVSATATVTEVDRYRVEFSVTASDEAGEIGSGKHTRFIVDRKSFMQKAINKKG